jgi:hypothetical protein
MAQRTRETDRKATASIGEHGHGALGRPQPPLVQGGSPSMTEDQAAATNRLRRKLEILKLDASKVRGQLFHDLQECVALMDIIDKRKED